MTKQDNLVQLRIVSSEQGMKLKALGFDVDCHQAYYHGTPSDDRLMWIYSEEPDFCLAPTVAMANKWLRDNHKIHVNVISNYNEHGAIYFCDIKTYTDDTFASELLQDKSPLAGVVFATIFESYEDAESAGLDLGLKKLENSK